MADPSVELLARLEQATADARDLVRDAHAATKDLRKVTREASELLDRKLGAEVEERLKQLIDSKIAELSEDFRQVTEEATKRVYERFDRLAKILTGRFRPGQEPLESLVERVAARQRHDLVARQRQRAKGADDGT